jgi:hypothetical protein
MCGTLKLVKRRRRNNLNLHFSGYETRRLAAVLLASKVEESRISFRELQELHDRATDAAIKKAELDLLQVMFEVLNTKPNWIRYASFGGGNFVSYINFTTS